MSKNNKEILKQYIEKYPFSGDIIRSDFKKLGVDIDFYEFEKWFAQNRNTKEIRDVISNSATSIKQNRKDLRGDLLKKIVELENRMIKGQEKSIRRIKRDKLDQTNSLAKIFDKLSKDIKSEK